MSDETTIPTDEQNDEFQQESSQPALEASPVEEGDIEKDQDDVEKETEISSSATADDHSVESVVADQSTQSSLEVGAAADLDKQDSPKRVIAYFEIRKRSQKDGTTSVKSEDEFQRGVAASRTESQAEGARQDLDVLPLESASSIGDSSAVTDSQLPAVVSGTKRQDSQGSNTGSSSAGDSLETVIGGVQSSVESGAAGDISSSLDSQEGPSPPSSNTGDSRKGSVPLSTGDSQLGTTAPSSNSGDAQESAVAGSSDPRDSAKRAIPRSSDPRDSAKGAILRSSDPRDSAKGAIPRSSDPGDSAKGAIPRSSDPRDSAKEAIPRSSDPRDSAKEAIPRSSNTAVSQKGAIPLSFNTRDSAKGAIPKSRYSEKGAIPRSSNTGDSRKEAVPSSSNTKDSQETAGAGDLGGGLLESGAAGDISSSTTPPCIFISSLPPIPPGRLPWDYDSGETPPRDNTVSSGCFPFNGRTPVRSAAGNTRGYDQCFSKCCGVCDYLRPCCRWIRKSKIFKFIRIALLMIPIVYMSFGLYYMDSCPVQTNLSVLMIVSGIVGLVLLISSLLIDERRFICPNVWKEVLTLGMIVGRIIFLAIFAAVLNATYSITPSFEHGSAIYCDEIFYYFTYYANFVVCGIVILAFLIYVPGINDVDYERI